MRNIVFTRLNETTGTFTTVYDTAAAAHQWTLSAFDAGKPSRQTSYLTVPGRADGPIDQSTLLTDGVPTYGSRQMTATLECSDGTRAQRNARMDDLVNALDGYEFCIFGPDDPMSGEGSKFLRGTISAVPQYSDMAHAAVKITGVCEPWRYNNTLMSLNTTTGVITLAPAGRRAAEPRVTMSLTGRIVSGHDAWPTVANVEQVPPGLVLLPGRNTQIKAQVQYGTTWTDVAAQLTVTYREGWL